MDHSRYLTLEEGEVFRKGTALGAADTDDEELDEVSGEELRKEVRRLRRPRCRLFADSSSVQILETEVERSPRPISLLSSEPSSSSPVEGDSLRT